MNYSYYPVEYSTFEKNVLKKFIGYWIIYLFTIRIKMGIFILCDKMKWGLSPYVII